MRKTLIFPYIKYIKPSWYFNLNGTRSYPLWVNYDLLDLSVKKNIDFDEGYSSREAALRDAAYQALCKGVISNDERLSLKQFDKVSLDDNYRFVRKYFNKYWALVILVIRFFSFCNPFKEIRAFAKTKNVRKINIYTSHIKYDNFLKDSQSLLSKNPKVSVIIPTLNRYFYLKDVLNDLSRQTYKNFDVLVCDQTDPADMEFYKQFKALDLKVIVQEEKALWKARNRCIKESDSQFLLLFDDDSRVDPDWIVNHLRCLDFFDADISSGVSLSVVGAKIPENYSFFSRSDQLDTGNVLIRREVFSKVGLFDRQFEKQRMGDGEFGLRCYLEGITNISNPMAKRVHLKVSSGGLRQMGSWDGLRPKKLFAPKPVPSVLYLVRKYFGASTAFLLLLMEVPFSIMPYKYKGSVRYNLLSVIVFVLLFPIFGLQVYMSWRRASKMLKEGALIEFL
ncbi:glycosyltransferase family 2 protein [Marinilabilia salmonicolor]|uniref:glycosyltransferase family 2 protein n=1 Tax=Marinilabilia salmonicolor TaxID=989 RepID=UPI00029A25A9|nr:glycosyltransferase family A protein [Marinilabilia salmonicolor]